MPLTPYGKAERASKILYECGCCNCLHPWSWDGDCRDDSNRYGAAEDYAERHSVDPYSIEVRSAEDRADADLRGE